MNGEGLSPEELAAIIASVARPVAQPLAGMEDAPVGTTVTVAGIDFVKIGDDPFPDPTEWHGGRPVEVVPLPDPVPVVAPPPGPPPAPDAVRAAIVAELTDARPRVPICTVCRKPLDGWHLPHDVGDRAADGSILKEPPSTLADLRGVLVDYDNNRPRSQQTEIGPSEMAVPCDRRLGYALTGTPEIKSGRVKWPPLVGTAVHALIADALAEDNARMATTGLGKPPRWLIEERVIPDPTNPRGGCCDAYDTHTDCVIDWKVVGPTALARYRKHGPGPQYRGQIQLYGRGWERAGRRPLWVRIVFLSRTTEYEDGYEWTEAYRPAYAVAVLDRKRRVGNLLTELDVVNHPDRWEQVTATPDRLCHWCPYYRRGMPADVTGCPGDVEADAKYLTKTSGGIIPPDGTTDTGVQQ